MADTFKLHGRAWYSGSGMGQAQSFHIWNAISAKMRGVGLSLQKQLGQFLRKKRGELSYGEFGRKLRISTSTLYRLERAEQSITLGKLEDLLRKLKVTIRDVFQ